MRDKNTKHFSYDNKQLVDEVKKNIVTCQRSSLIFAILRMSKALSVSSYVQWRNDLDANQNIGINSLNDNRQYRIFN